MGVFYNCSLAVLIVLVSQISIGESIECYVCKSEMDPLCATDEPGEQYLKDCSTLKEGPKYEACRKLENWVDFEVLEQKPIKRVIRQCAADVDKDRPCYYRAGFGGRANVCDCFESKCNYASKAYNSLITMALCLFAVFFNKFL